MWRWIRPPCWGGSGPWHRRRCATASTASSGPPRSCWCPGWATWCGPIPWPAPPPAPVTPRPTDAVPASCWGRPRTGWSTRSPSTWSTTRSCRGAPTWTRSRNRRWWRPGRCSTWPRWWRAGCRTRHRRCWTWWRRCTPPPRWAAGPGPRPWRCQAELEGVDRGRYAGPVGWVDAAGNGAWGVGIRGVQVDGTSARLVRRGGRGGGLRSRGRAGGDPGQGPGASSGALIRL